MIKTIYLITILILIIIAVYIFVDKYSVHQTEIAKIHKLEHNHEEKHKVIKYNSFC